MHFRLLYQGPIKTRASIEEKNTIRLCFHSQLKYLWDQIPLKTLKSSVFHQPQDADDVGILQEINGNYFAPLACSRLKLVADIDLVLLRDEEPGHIISSGDIDNRLKTLFDSMRMPKDQQEIAQNTPANDINNPIYCLLEDDNLITSVRVDVDRFLCANTPDEVLLLIYVAVRPTQLMYKNLDTVII